MVVNKYRIPGRGFLWVALIAIVSFASLMSLFFDQRGWEFRDILFMAVLGVVALGLAVTLINAERFWWGLRIVTFIVFACYLCYLLFEFWWAKGRISVSARGEAASPLDSVLGFLCFGVPSLLYTFWGSIWGKLGQANPENVNRWDVVTYYFAQGALCLFLLLSAIAFIVTLRS